MTALTSASVHGNGAPGRAEGAGADEEEAEAGASWPPAEEEAAARPTAEETRSGEGWNDGLIARRSPNASAVTVGRTSPVRGLEEAGDGEESASEGTGTAGRCPEGPHVHGADAHGSFPHVDRTHGSETAAGHQPLEAVRQVPPPWESDAAETTSAARPIDTTQPMGTADRVDTGPHTGERTGPRTEHQEVADGTNGQGGHDTTADGAAGTAPAETAPAAGARPHPTRRTSEHGARADDPATRDRDTADSGTTGRVTAPGETLAAIATGGLRRRLGALRELIGLSRTRLEGRVLAEAGRVLDEASARGRLSGAYTTVAIAGATGSGKSSLLNALASRELSEVGLRRPTTAEPVACTWEAERAGGADGLLDRLGVAPGVRRRVKDAELHGLVVIDLPDHDSLAPGHREQVDRLLELVDAVVWVVDPEKYADAVLHERYLRPLAGYAEVTFVVLNQVDRLPGDAADTVLDDLRRLLDEDGVALGEHGEPGARVLALSALTGTGMREFRQELGEFVATREVPGRRLTADLDGATERLRPVYADPALSAPVGLSQTDREEFEDRLASAVGAAAAGQAAERAWLRHAERACGTPWSQLVRRRDAVRRGGTEVAGPASELAAGPPSTDGEAVVEASPGQSGEGVTVARPVLAQAVRELADRAVTGLPQAWRTTVRGAAWRGAEGLPEALDSVVAEVMVDTESTYGHEPRRYTTSAASPAHIPRPAWWTVATVAQGLLLALQVLGVFLLGGAAIGSFDGPLWLPVLLLLGGALAAPALAAACRAAARGPARVYGREEERRLRRLAAGCGRTRVLEPVAAELLRYREVREQYVIAAGDTEAP